MKGLIAMAISMAAASVLADLPRLRVDGMSLLDPSGKAVTLKGVNLGNWLMIEMWMLGLADLPGMPADQYELEKVLTERFGEAEKNRLMDVYRASWITERDFKLMPTFGFNLVRLPMNYRLFEDDREPFKLKKDAWKWIDHAVELAEKHGLYTILDMHGVQGGQSPYDHTGHSNQNRLKDDEQAQKRLAWLWGEVAKRYRSRSAVVAYDVFNEPYGTPKDIQVKVFKMALAEIRKHDPQKLVLAHGNYDDFQHYGDPKANGWKNVGFQMHYYPGLFGGGDPTLRTHIRHLQFLEGLDKTVKKYNVPFLIGEMNVVFDSAGGAEMMRRYFEAHAKNGWMTTMWSWKAASTEGGVQPAIWGAVVNKEPVKPIDFRKATKEEIEARFQSYATEELVVYDALRKHLSGSGGPLSPLPELPPARKSAPQQELPGWKQAEVGDGLKGGLERLPSGGFALYGAGADVWAEQDQARLLYQEVSGDFKLEVTVVSAEDIHQYTKAGLMVRSSLAQNAAALVVSTFPSGGIQLAYRPGAGKVMDGIKDADGKLPGLKLRIVRSGGRILCSYADEKGQWKELGAVEDAFPDKVFAGVFALSHDNERLAKIEYRGLKLTQR